MVACGCGANLSAVWDALFLTQWTQSLSFTNTLLYISLFLFLLFPPFSVVYSLTSSQGTRVYFRVSLFPLALFLPFVSLTLFRDALFLLPHAQLNYSKPLF